MINFDTDTGTWTVHVNGPLERTFVYRRETYSVFCFEYLKLRFSEVGAALHRKIVNHWIVKYTNKRIDFSSHEKFQDFCTTNEQQIFLEQNFPTSWAGTGTAVWRKNNFYILCCNAFVKC